MLKEVYGSREDIAKVISLWRPPVLVVSSIVGRGNYSLGEALLELWDDKREVYHLPVEEVLPFNALREDFFRYKDISDNFPFLLNLVYRFSIFYQRKLIRENIFKTTSLDKIRNVIESLNIKTVVCVSHRPTFWLSVLKKRTDLDYSLWGVLTEFGETPGWKYIFWEKVNGYITYLDKNYLNYKFPEGLNYFKTKPFCRRSFYDISGSKGDVNKVLFIAGYWGQIFFNKAKNILLQILNELPEIHISVICGTNKKLFKRLSSYFANRDDVTVYGEIDSLSEIMRGCASVITKPGFSTIIETCIAKRALFLLRGMPVAEDHNAKYAIKHFSAQWFTLRKFKTWYHAQSRYALDGGSSRLIICPLCGNMSYEKVLEDYDRLTGVPGIFFLVKCKRCELLHVIPRLVKKELYAFYPDTYPAYLRFDENSKKYSLNINFYLLRIYMWLKSYSFSSRLWKIFIAPLRVFGEINFNLIKLNSQSKVLDVGCATGFFISHLKWLIGCEVKGVELNDQARREANRTLGDGSVFADLLENNYFKDESFNLVTMWFTLEHLAEPAKTLDKISKLLKHNGWLVVAVPNIDSWNWHIFKERWAGLDMPRHLQHFTVHTLKLFLERYNFKVKKVKFGYSTYNFIGSLQIALFKRRYFSKAATNVLDIQYNILLKFITLPYCILAALFRKSDTFVVYAQKNK